MDVATLSLNAQLIGQSSQKTATDNNDRTTPVIDQSSESVDASILDISPEGQSARVMSMSAKEILARINKQLGLPEEQRNRFRM